MFAWMTMRRLLESAYKPAWAGSTCPPTHFLLTVSPMLNLHIVSPTLRNHCYCPSTSLMSLALVLSLVFCAQITSGETIRLGGPRDIVVEIQDVPNGFSVAVDMRAVSCFDAATNSRVNRSKAYLYGLAGLERSLAVEPGQLNVARHIASVQITASQLVAGRYRLEFFLPETSLSVHDRRPLSSEIISRPSDTTDKAPQDRSQLFTCVEDYAMTIKELNRVFNERIQNAANAVITTDIAEVMDEELNAARNALSQVKMEADTAFTSVAVEVAADLRVLSVEQAHLNDVLAHARADFDASAARAQSSLQALVKQAEAQPNPPTLDSTSRPSAKQK
jgi:hypothetical protein